MDEIQMVNTLLRRVRAKMPVALGGLNAWQMRFVMDLARRQRADSSLRLTRGQRGKLAEIYRAKG